MFIETCDKYVHWVHRTSRPDHTSILHNFTFTVRRPDLNIYDLVHKERILVQWSRTYLYMRMLPLEQAINERLRTVSVSILHELGRSRQVVASLPSLNETKKADKVIFTRYTDT